MPNFTGVIASPRLTCVDRALNAATPARRSSKPLVSLSRVQISVMRSALLDSLAVVRRIAVAVEVALADDVRGDRELGCARRGPPR
jgi:hypothetical protein